MGGMDDGCYWVILFGRKNPPCGTAILVPAEVSELFDRKNSPSGTAILVSAEVSGLFGRKNPPSGTPILVPAGVRLFFSQDKTYSTEDKESYSTLAGVGLC